MSYTCPRCGATSYNPHDAAHGYCGRCHAFTGDDMSDDQASNLNAVLLALGFCAGALSRPEIFTALAESVQNGGTQPHRLVMLRDSLTRVLQLAGVEELPR